jgi:hypothetical protein
MILSLTIHCLCSHALACYTKNHLNFTQFVDGYYTVQSYRSTYGMSFLPLPDELEWTDYIGPQVEVNSSI